MTFIDLPQPTAKQVRIAAMAMARCGQSRSLIEHRFPIKTRAAARAFYDLEAMRLREESRILPKIRRFFARFKAAWIVAEGEREAHQQRIISAHQKVRS